MEKIDKNNLDEFSAAVEDVSLKIVGNLVYIISGTMDNFDVYINDQCPNPKLINNFKDSVYTTVDVNLLKTIIGSIIERHDNEKYIKSDLKDSIKTTWKIETGEEF